eukprot:TRINITY_DN5554_c0_g1_i5.p1 TRINITY_DN5554_c0_g1~~TRINITY_DN5554_c0_g1_i5.p1  ORF type:complete len:323 (-),score=75.12 TRINITY_DN5554_c0_g1_i5:234-1202(-)
MMRTIALLALLSFATALTQLSVIANGSLPDGSSGIAAGAGRGANVQGDAIVALNATTSRSSVVLSATGSPSSPSPSPSPSPQAAPVPVTTTKVKPAPAPTVYVKQMQEAKPNAKCADIKNDMCPAMSEFKNCGYCILQKYPLVGHGCEVEKVLVKKDGSKGEYEVMSKPSCDCPEGALYIEDPKYCPSCNLALMELLACSGVAEMPSNLAAVEISASCVEKVKVSTEFLTECGFIKPEAAPVTLVVDPKTESAPAKNDKKYVVVDPKVETAPAKSDKKYVTVTPEAASAPKPAIATATASASGTGTASATATATSSSSSKGL